MGDDGRPDGLDVEALGRLLLGSRREVRLAARALAARPELQKVEGLSLDEHRARVLEQLHLLVDDGLVHRAFPRRFGGEEDHGGNVAGFEELVTADPSLQIKAGVQWGLFGAAVLHLGTSAHHERLLPDIMSLAVPGCFAMTEIGHGSDVASLATTAVYDPDAGEFEIHTPFRAAWKEFIGNAARDGRAAVVFAQLVTRGVNHGVHAFYVPIRDAHGALLPGVASEDDGLKGGLVGVDNGRLAFDHVRVPRESLLNRYGDVAPDGEYSSPIASPGRRFFTMLGTLVQGRVSLDGAATTASAMGLTIAVTYANERRQFAPEHGAEEEVLLDYRQHQHRLLPRLAAAYAHTFAHEGLLTVFDRVFSDPGASDESRQDLETLAAALKPLSTWQALETLQEAREACGGAGFMAENRIVGLRADLDVFATFEGDNTVLLQLVAKRLLGDYARGLSRGGPAALARALGRAGLERAVDGTGLRGLAQTLADRGRAERAAAGILGTRAQRALLAGRVESLVAAAAAALRPAARLSGRAAADLANEHQPDLIEAGRAYGELLQWEAFTAVLDAGGLDPRTAAVLRDLRDLFGLGLIGAHLDRHLASGRLSPRRGRAVAAEADRLVTRLRPHAQALVDAFGFTPDTLRATIASGVEGVRQREAAEHRSALERSGGAPVDERTLRHR